MSDPVTDPEGPGLPGEPPRSEPPQSAPLHPPIPPVSRRSRPRFRTRERRSELAAAFTQAGPEYDRLRPGYPQAAIDAVLAAAPRAAQTAVDLGAGTGKLALALAGHGLQVTAADPSQSLLEIAAAADPSGRLRTVVAPAEATGLPAASADVITAAQSWHWFDPDAASTEARRLLRPGGVLALLWNSLDVRIPWVHRYSRIMHAGDIQREDFSPPVGAGYALLDRRTIRWEDAMTTGDLIDLARTRSYLLTADDPTRQRVLSNLDWYVHEHLGHAVGSVVGLPYRTDLFLYRAGGEAGEGT